MVRYDYRTTGANVLAHPVNGGPFPLTALPLPKASSPLRFVQCPASSVSMSRWKAERRSCALWPCGMLGGSSGAGGGELGEGVVRSGGYRYPDGSRYVGGWSSEGRKQGFGHLWLEDGSRYVGGFRRGLCSGLGVMVFPDGARYEGELMEGWFHGHGVFTRGDGMKYEGEFRGGRLWGWGLVTFKDLSHGFPRQEGFFQDCRLLRNRRCTEVVERAQKVALLARGRAGL